MIWNSTPTSYIEAKINQINILFDAIQIRDLPTVSRWFRNHDSTPTSYIEIKFNIFLDPKQIKKFATATTWFVLFESHQHSTLNQTQYIVQIEIRNLLSALTQFTICYSIPASFKFNIFLDTIPIIHCTIAPTRFVIPHQHPTNSIYFWI